MPDSKPYLPGPQTEIGRSPLRDIVAIVARRKWQIAAVFAVSISLVAYWTFSQPKQYEARMKVFVKNFRADMVVSGASTAQTSPPSEVSEAKINTEIELLGSNDLLRQVATASKLATLESPQGSAPGDQQQFQLERAVARLHRDLKISPVRKADIIEIDYVANNPHQVITVLTQLAASYLEAHVRIHGSPGTYEFFSKQADHYVEELKNAETAFTDFRLKKDIVLFGQQKEEILRRASEASSTLLATEASIHEYMQAIADARAQAAAAAPRVITQSRAVSNQSSVERLIT
ncbi:MAG: lipopolysaccharide biosynthesis protein, partial [Bryobacterales bacterium]|nr:lipopolysaccharide biosynthesis protein [Bryobacterales bacterium]